MKCDYRSWSGWSWSCTPRHLTPTPPAEGGGAQGVGGKKNIITIIKTIVISSFGGCRCGGAREQRNPFKLEPAFARGDLFKMSNLVRIQLKMKTLVSLGLTAMVCQWLRVMLAASTRNNQAANEQTMPSTRAERHCTTTGRFAHQTLYSRKKATNTSREPKWQISLKSLSQSHRIRWFQSHIPKEIVVLFFWLSNPEELQIENQNFNENKSWQRHIKKYKSLPGHVKWNKSWAGSFWGG